MGDNEITWRTMRKIVRNKNNLDHHQDQRRIMRRTEENEITWRTKRKPVRNKNNLDHHQDQQGG